VPRYPDDDLVPPLKVMRKRLNGVYRADSGFSGPTRRYVLLVALLVGLASVPTLAAITAGSNELADGRSDTLDVPVLPPASPGPITPPGRGEVPQSGLPPTAQGGSDGAQAAVRAGRLMGETGKRRPRPVDRSGSADRGGSADQGGSDDPGGRRGGHAGEPAGGAPSSGSDQRGQAADPSMIAFPALPGMRTLPGLPSVGGRKGPDGGERPDKSPGHGRPSGSSSPEEPSSGGTPSSDPEPSSPDTPPSGEPTSSSPDKSDTPEPSDSDDDLGDQRPELPDPLHEPPAWATRPYCHERGKCGAPKSHHHRPDKSRQRPCEESSRRRKQVRSTVSHRSPDRSEHSRRSTVTERPRNVRPASILERSYAYPSAPAGHNRRHIPESRGDDNQNAYRGAHRASQHHADDHTPAQRRSSRVGRHHAEHSEDLSGRW
jgi:hypothetical protein